MSLWNDRIVIPQEKKKKEKENLKCSTALFLHSLHAYSANAAWFINIACEQ